MYEAYFKAFPDLKRYFDKVQKETLSRGYILIDSITRRKNWYFPPRDKKEEGEIKRKALNFPIQGTAGSITKLAAINVRKYLTKGGLDGKVLLTNLVHDEINLESINVYSHTVSEDLVEIMEKAGTHWCKTVPLRANAKVSAYWGH